jgi:hypothetical protein
MDLSLVADNLLNPPILFFVMGLLAVWFRSDLEIPQPLPKLFSLYLLFSIGYEGGVRLGASGFSPYVLLCIGLALFMATLVPVYSYFILRAKLDVPNAAAIAATYGSISAVTFLTAVAFLGKIGLPYGGHMVAGMALMESPAIVVGVLLARRFGAASTSPERTLNWKHLLREAVANASVFMLLGSLIIGVLTGEKAAPSMEPFTHHIFKGMLSFFLLDIGLVAARKMGDLKKSGPFLIGFGLLMPLFNAALGIGLARLIGMTPGDAILFAVLCGSASYIAVPAAMRLALPEANPSLYVSMALAVTFPFNIVLGIPLYTLLVKTIWGI